ncbi:uncharacterized protein [Dermacentor andersoni]|uniref:uncharacterized protein n=1 Tax=Dermacentor andersoni TaxID=34620 RepID=UPI0024162D9B|nr:uncharacterized protein LOC129387614 [Dermacentor andersoni]
MILALVASVIVSSVASNKILHAKEAQALRIPESPSVGEKKPQQLEDLPLYQPTVADPLDLIKHPPTTVSAPYIEPVPINNEYRKVYKVRGDYDIRMKDINKRAKERKKQDVLDKNLPGEGATDSTNSTASNDDKDSRLQTRRIPGLKRPPRPHSRERSDVRRRNIPRPSSDSDRRHRRRDPGYEPETGPLPSTSSRRPVWQPDDNGVPWSSRRGARTPNRRRGAAGRITPPAKPADTWPPFSIELKHGVKIVSEPGSRPQQEPLPKHETPSLLPRETSEGTGTQQGTDVKDDPISLHMTEAFAQEPLMPYDKVVDEDTTEAVDVSRLVQENAFDFRLRELKKQQELAESKTLLDDGDEPDPSLSPVEEYSKEERDEENNVSLIGQQPIITSPLVPQKPSATAEGDQIVEIEDLGFELAPKKNASSSQGRLLVPIVDDSFETDELANATVSATIQTPLDIGGDVIDEELANLTLTDAKMKRRKYSIASRIRLANETLYNDWSNTTNSSGARLTRQSVEPNLDMENRNTSNKLISGSFVQVWSRKSRNSRRGMANVKSTNDTLKVSRTNGTDANRAVVTTITPKIIQDVRTTKLVMTNGTRKLRRKKVISVNRTVLTTIPKIKIQEDGAKRFMMANRTKQVKREKVKCGNRTGLTTMPPVKLRSVGATKLKLENNLGKVTRKNVTGENNTLVHTRSRIEAHGAGRRKGCDNSNTTLLSWVWGTQATTAKSKVVVHPKETTFSWSNNYSDPVIETEGSHSSNCTMILPKNHPPLTHQADASHVISQWKYFEDKVQPLLPGETTTPQELRNTVITLRNYIIQSSIPRWSIDSDYFRKAGVLTSLFPQSKRGVPVNFLFYSRNSSITPITLQNDAKSLQAVSLYPDSKLQVIFHDFDQGASERWVKQLKDALLKEGNCNHVLVVGWRQAASRNYWTAVANSRPVGRKLACLLRRLRDERGLRLSNVHLVGLGLGAHVARYAAVSVIHKLCERVGRVTGLDVSAPLFEEFGETLNAAAAEYVDLIHTSADFVGGLRGQIAATGHVDYYTSGVFSPKSCILSRKDFRRDCDRAQSAELFVKSVRDGCGYRSTSCEFWSTADTCSGCGPRGCGHIGFRSPSANGTGPQFLPMRMPTLNCEDKPVVAR